jgi:hypothetical protein
MKTRVSHAPTADAEDNADGLAVHPFESVESAHEYVGMLLQAIQETATEVGADLRDTHAGVSARRREAFQLIAYKLEQLRFHVAASRRRLNDLRTLRRMLESGSAALAG